nr:protein kinase [Streptomyces sp. DSM 41633]
TRLDRVVALKVMHPELAADASFVERFIREARSVARLSHPNVVGVFDQGAEGAYVYLAMEYVPGCTLRDVLRERGALTPRAALDVLEPVLAALGAACLVPFLARTSPYWQRPIPTDHAKPVAARWRRVPLLPFWRRVLHRPNLLLELLLIRAVYSAYSQVRLAATAGRPVAEEHGRQIHAIEQWLHIDIEL